jgi:two-component system osmolarity sensor histidine kinase EnvZ
MRLAPASLFGRNLLLIVALILLGQLGSAAMFRAFVQGPRVDQAADAFARTLRGMHDGLQALPDSQRAAFAQRFNASTRNSLSPVSPDVRPPAMQRELAPLERRFVRRVAQQLGPLGARLVWQPRQGGGMAVRLQVERGKEAAAGGEQAYWLDLPGLLPAREWPRAWVYASGATALLALGGAWLIQRRLNRPLNEVVAAASSLARGERPPALDESGPSEIAALARSFNRMVEDLARNEREREVMLAGISHDLRTPLAKLRLAVELGSGKLDAQLATSMDNAVTTLDAIVGQFMDYARGIQDEAAVLTDIDALARRAVAACGVPVHWQPGAPPPCRVRPVALQRALVNLLENAQRYAGTASPIELASGQAGAEVWLEVRDRGPGLGGADAESLKQPFQRGDAARSGVPGSGLGLAVADRAMRAHGGRLELLPREGGGLRARLAWPTATH